MITIKQIQNNATVTDGTDTVTLGAGDSYTCSPPVINEYMELVIDTTISGGTASDSFSFPLSGVGLIDWGEGSGDEFFNSTTSNINAINTRQYSSGGIYTVRFKGGGFFRTDGNSDRTKLIELKNCGSGLIFRDGTNLFIDCVNLVNTSIDSLLIGGSNLSSTFRNTNMSIPPSLLSYNITSCFNIFRQSSLNADLGYIDLRRCNNFINFAFLVTTWSTENYGNTLLGWLRWDSTTHAPAVGWVLQSNQNFHGGNSTLVTGSEAALARDYLINTLNWTITDGGLI